MGFALIICGSNDEVVHLCDDLLNRHARQERDYHELFLLDSYRDRNNETKNLVELRVPDFGERHHGEILEQEKQIELVSVSNDCGSLVQGHGGEIYELGQQIGSLHYERGSQHVLVSGVSVNGGEGVENNSEQDYDLSRHVLMDLFPKLYGHSQVAPHSLDHNTVHYCKVNRQ